MNKKLQEAWEKRLELIAEGYKLLDKGDEFRAEGWKLQTEGYKLQIEGNKLCAEGNLLWANAVIEVYGKDMTIEWVCNKEKQSWECHLGNGEVYKP